MLNYSVIALLWRWSLRGFRCFIDEEYIYKYIYMYTRLEFKRLDEQKCWRMFELARVG